MKKIGKNFTAVVIARNEQSRLPLVLLNFLCLENVLVVDNYSTDNTRKIAESFRRPWIQVKNEGGFVETDGWMKPVWEQIDTEYMLLAACAEDLPLELLKKYDEISSHRSHDAVFVKRISITAGLPIPIDYPPWWMAWRYKGELRFFKIGSVDYSSNLVHGRGRIMCCEGKVLYLPRCRSLSFYQYRDYDSFETESKHVIYNDISARQLSAGVGFGLMLSILKGVRRFIIIYFLYGAFRYGVLGFMHSYYRFHMELGLSFRVYEYRNKLTKMNITKANIEIRKNRLK
jgi:glycosyltransferase involved in cell wall biosynthesis